MLRTIAKLFAVVLAAPLLVATSTASAAPDRAACGNINLLAAGKCEFLFEGGCTTQCQPLNFIAACEGQCNVTIDASCTTSCSATCEADCVAQGPSFSCEASCKADCGGTCMANCSAAANMADCSSYCQGRCSSDCKAQCNAVAGSVDCKAQCQGCCSGSCQARADFDCNYKCSSMLTGGCQTDCTTPNGALFCDGQYVNVTNIDDCVAYLESQYELNIQFEAEASASVTCAAAPVGDAPLDVGAIAAIAVGAGFIVSRRRRRA
jgi:hypothetical protein